MGDGIRHVYIVGCKGIPARYGGFETFVEKLTENRASDRIRYHVACAVDEMPEDPEYEHNGAHCFCVKWRPWALRARSSTTSTRSDVRSATPSATASSIPSSTCSPAG